MKKVTVNGMSYMGTLVKTDDGIVIKNGLECPSGKLSKTVIAKYIETKNFDRLQDITFSGTGISYSVTDLTGLEALYLSVCKKTMKYAKKNAIAGNENELFNRVMGK